MTTSTKQIDALIDQYFPHIEVSDTYFGDETNNAHLVLYVPLSMFQDYLRIKQQYCLTDDSIWKNGSLAEKLRNSDKYHGQGHEPLEDMLEFLGGTVQVTFTPMTFPANMVRVSIQEDSCE